MAVAALACDSTQRKMVACHACSSTEDSTYLLARGYRIARCRNCGLWFVNPQPTPEELRRFYAAYDDGEQWRNREEPFNRAIRGAVLRTKRSGTVLDVGCGSGNFLNCMRKMGFSVFGIEPSESGAAYARSTHAIDVYHGMLEDFVRQNSRRRFDVITLLNVLEHLSHPADLLLQLRQLLVADGLLVIVVPDARFHDVLGRFRRTLGVPDPFWIERPKSFLSGFKLPDHLCSFQPVTISALLRRCGFRVAAMENAPVVFNAALHRDAAKLFVYQMAKALHYLTFRKVLIGYSTLVLAKQI